MEWWRQATAGVVEQSLAQAGAKLAVDAEARNAALAKRSAEAILNMRNGSVLTHTGIWRSPSCLVLITGLADPGVPEQLVYLSEREREALI